MAMKKCMFIICVVFFVFALSCSAYAGLTDGLVAYYPFNGNANDESGNGNNGTVYGATLAADRFGNPNSAYSFDGVDDDILIGDKVDAENKNLTLNAWINSSDYTHSVQIVNKGCTNSGTPVNSGYSLSVFDEVSYPGRSGIYFYFGDDNSQIPNQCYIPTADIPTNKWLMVTGTLTRVSGSCTLKLYLNGNLASSDVAVLQSSNTNMPLTIGSMRRDYVNLSSPYRTNLFNGLIDDVRIYNRALSEDEIKELYGGGDECYTEADIEAAREEARQETISQCQNDPSSCGIPCGGGEAATLSEDLSLLQIPLVNYQTLFGNIPCWLDMTYAPINNRILFEVTNFGLIE